ncbi:MAG: hypothetical protein IT382_22470 [Deltaproteobacteria bacterium]|nr:hypothetical protein [Deltaproteobacteria bacterium]
MRALPGAREHPTMVALMAVAAASLLLPLWVASAPLVVAVDAADPVLRGAVALALVEDGAVVVAGSAASAVLLRALSDGAGLQLATVGASERAATVAGGAPALMELEAIHRALALVRATPARPAEAPAAIFLDVDDRAAAVAASPRLAESLAAALLEASVPLAPPAHAAERLCVVATASELTLSWGKSAARCDGRQMGVARAGLSPRGVVDDALRLRDAAAPPRPWRSGSAAVSGPAVPPTLTATATPASAPLPKDGPGATASSATAPIPTAPIPTAPIPTAPIPTASAAPVSTAPVSMAAVSTAPAPTAPASTATVASPRRSARELAVDARVGALGRPLALDPLVELELRWLPWRGVAAGPVVWLASSGAVEPLPILELAVGGGVGGSWSVADDVDLGAGLVLGGLAHGWRYSGDDAGIAFDALLAAPLTLCWTPAWLGGAWGASLALTPGALTRSRAHQIQGVVSWARGALFLGISAGLTWDISASRGPVENSSAPPRGVGDG